MAVVTLTLKIDIETVSPDIVESYLRTKLEDLSMEMVKNFSKCNIESDIQSS